MRYFWFRSSVQIEGAGLSFSTDGINFTPFETGSALNTAQGVLVIKGEITSAVLSTLTPPMGWAEDNLLEPLILGDTPRIESTQFNSIWVDLLEKGIGDLLPSFIDRNAALIGFYQAVSVFYAILNLLKLDVRDFTEDDQRVAAFLRGFSQLAYKDPKDFLARRAEKALRRGSMASIEEDLKDALLFDSGDEYLSLYKPNPIWVPSKTSLFARQPGKGELNKLSIGRRSIALGTAEAMIGVSNIPISPSQSYLLRVEVAGEANMQLTLPGDLRASFAEAQNIDILYADTIPNVRRPDNTLIPFLYEKVLFSAEDTFPANVRDTNGQPLIGFGTGIGDAINLSLCFADANTFLIAFTQTADSVTGAEGWRDYPGDVIFAGGGRESTRYAGFRLPPDREALIEGDWLTVENISTQGLTSYTATENTSPNRRVGTIRLRFLRDGELFTTPPQRIVQMGNVVGDFAWKISAVNGRFRTSFNRNLSITIIASGPPRSPDPTLVSFNENVISAEFADINSSVNLSILQVSVRGYTSGPDLAIETIVSGAETVITPAPIELIDFSLQPLDLPSQCVTLAGSKRLFLYLKNNNSALLFNDILLYLNDYYAEPDLEISALQLLSTQINFLALEEDGCLILLEVDGGEGSIIL